MQRPDLETSSPFGSEASARASELDLVEGFLVARDEDRLQDFLDERSPAELATIRRQLELLADMDVVAGLLDADPLGLEGDAGSRIEATPLTDASNLGRYTILHLLGEGGLSRVYLAHDRVLGREVALKVLRHEFLDPDESARWLEREGRSIAGCSTSARSRDAPTSR